MAIQVKKIYNFGIFLRRVQETPHAIPHIFFVFLFSLPLCQLPLLDKEPLLSANSFVTSFVLWFLHTAPILRQEGGKYKYGYVCGRVRVCVYVFVGQRNSGNFG